MATSIAIAGMALTAAPAFAGNITVTVLTDGAPATNSSCTLREAILEANSNNDATSPDCDFSPDASGTDTITLTAANYAVTSGLLQPTESLILTNPSGLAMLDGNGTDRIINQASGNLTMNRVGVKEGFTSGSGAGIVANAGLTISNATVELNESNSTGGPSIGGGGILMAGGGNLVADRVLFMQNRAISTSGTASGGAVLFSPGSGGSITNSEFAQNTAATTTTTALARGGAIAVPGANANANTLDVSGTLFSGNQAGQTLGAGGTNSNFGGAIFWSDSSTVTSAELRVDNSTFVSNIANLSTTNGGGAINLQDGTGKLAQVTFANNATTGAANEGDAIRYQGAAGTGSFVIRGTIFDDSGTDECRATGAIGFTSVGGNVDQGTTCPFLAGQDKQNQDAATLTQTNNGGPTSTRALPSTSPAIDANGGCTSTSGGLVTNDQRGFARGVTGPEDGSACDSGAYERLTCKELNVTVSGTDSDNGSLTGTANSDVIAGFGGNDSITGGDNADTICGGAGDDLMSGEAGADTYDGGTGTNTVSYGGAPTGVQVDLAAGTSGGGHGNDSGMDNVQSIFGSAFVDTLAGNASNNTIIGGFDGDALEGRGGDDTLDGGSFTGTDRVVYDEAPGGVRVKLGAGLQNTVADGFDTLIGLENVTGSGFDDELFGNGDPNNFNGGGGSDTADYSDLVGNTTVDLAAGTSSGTSGANDTFTSIENAITGSGDDTLTGDSGNNTLVGLGGSDTVTGGLGTDTLFGNAGTDSLFARDSVADTVDCGTEADTAEVDVQGTDTVNADCETVSFATVPQNPPSGTTPTTPAKPKCKKGQKLKKVKGKFKCVKKPKKRK